MTRFRKTNQVHKPNHRTWTIPRPTSRSFSTGDPLLLHFRQHPYPALNNGYFNPHHTLTYALNAFYGPDIGSFSEWLGFSVKIFKIWFFLVLILGSFFAIQDTGFSCFDFREFLCYSRYGFFLFWFTSVMFGTIILKMNLLWFIVL